MKTIELEDEVYWLLKAHTEMINEIDDPKRSKNDFSRVIGSLVKSYDRKYEDPLFMVAKILKENSS